MSSVDIRTSSRSTSAAAEKVSTSPSGRRRTGIVVWRSAHTSTMCCPLTNWAMSIQWEPMSPIARSDPPLPGSSRQFQSVG